MKLLWTTVRFEDGEEPGAYMKRMLESFAEMVSNHSLGELRICVSGIHIATRPECVKNRIINLLSLLLFLLLCCCLGGILSIPNNVRVVNETTKSLTVQWDVSIIEKVVIQYLQ